MKAESITVEIPKELRLTAAQNKKLKSLFHSAVVEVISGPPARVGKRPKQKQKEKVQMQVECKSKD